jgi:hypothetical protein
MLYFVSGFRDENGMSVHGCERTRNISCHVIVNEIAALAQIAGHSRHHANVTLRLGRELGSHLLAALFFSFL